MISKMTRSSFIKRREPLQAEKIEEESFIDDEELPPSSPKRDITEPWILEAPPCLMIHQPPFITPNTSSSTETSTSPPESPRTPRGSSKTFAFAITPTSRHTSKYLSPTFSSGVNRKDSFTAHLDSVTDKSGDLDSSSLYCSDDLSLIEFEVKEEPKLHKRAQSIAWITGIRHSSTSFSIKGSSRHDSSDSSEETFFRYLTSYHPRILIEHCVKKIDDLENLSPMVTTLLRAGLLMADISGFTQLNEKFAKEGSEGVEQVSTHLNKYFAKLLTTVNQYGGDCVKFAGDALIVLFRDENCTLEEIALKTVQCALAMQNKVGAYSANGIELSLHIGVSCGSVYAFHVGGIKGEWEFFLAGAPFKQIEGTLEKSCNGEVVVSGEVWELVGDRCKGRGTMGSHIFSSEMVVEEVLDTIPVTPVVMSEKPSVKLIKMLKAYTPRCVLEKLEAGMFHWLGEHRRASVIFVNLRGLELNTFGCDNAYLPHKVLKQMQKVLQRNHGFRRQYLVDDKGSTFISVFGVPPFAHEDDAYRAVKTALELQKTLVHMGLAYSIGVATGEVYVGSVGDDIVRKEHAVVGDTVNTAARLSGRAVSGQILCDSRTFDHVSVDFEMVPQGSLLLKGKSVSIQCFEPRVDVFGGNMVRSLTTATVGRYEECKMFLKIIENVKSDGNSGILWVSSSAGIGKTTLLQKFFQLGMRQKLQSSFVSANSTKIGGSFAVVQKMVRDLLSLDQGSVSFLKGISEQREDNMFNEIRSHLPVQLKHKTIEYQKFLQKDTTTLQSTGSPGRGRGSSTEVLDQYCELFCDLLKYLSKEYGPQILFIDNVHYLDTLTVTFLKKVLTTVQKDLIVVISSRSIAADRSDAHILDLARLPIVQKIRLRPLTEDQTAIVVRNKLKIQSITNIAEKHLKMLLKYVWKVSEGNPLFALETVSALKEAEIIKIDGNSLKVPHSLNSQVFLSYSLRKLMMGKFDTLSLEEQMFCKLASLFGSEFRQDSLYWIFQEETRISQRIFDSILSKLRSQQLLVATSKGSFAFAKLQFQQTCYEMILFKTRVRLHLALADHFEQLTVRRGYFTEINKGPDYIMLAQYQYLQALQSGHRNAVHALKALEYIKFQVYENLDWEHWDHIEGLVDKAVSIIELNHLKVVNESKVKSLKFVFWIAKALSKDVEILVAIRESEKVSELIKELEEILTQSVSMARELSQMQRQSLVMDLIRLWKCLWFTGRLHEALEVCQMLQFNEASSQDLIMRVEQKRMELWVLEALGCIDDALGVFKETHELIHTFECEISLTTAVDVLALGSVLYWVKGDHLASREVDDEALGLMRSFKGRLLDLEMAKLHYGRWRRVSMLSVGQLDDMERFEGELDTSRDVLCLITRSASERIGKGMISDDCRKMVLRGPSWDIYDHCANLTCRGSILDRIQFGHVFQSHGILGMLKCIGNVSLLRANDEDIDTEQAMEYIRLDLFTFADHFDSSPDRCPTLVLLLYAWFVELVKDSKAWTDRSSVLFAKIKSKCMECAQLIHQMDESVEDMYTRTLRLLDIWIS